MKKIAWRPVTGPSELGARAFEARLDTALRAWEGTPYMAGQQKESAGVDCVRFVAAVMDDLLRRPRTPIATLPADAALHDRDGAIAAMKRLRLAFMPNRFLEDGELLEPGDIVVTGPSAGGPGHAMIVGARRSTLWHATRLGVQWTGLAPPPGHAVFRAYRLLDEERAA
jgi:cell wall-associated NlpC family hydrolase